MNDFPHDTVVAYSTGHQARIQEWADNCNRWCAEQGGTLGHDVPAATPVDGGGLDICSLTGQHTVVASGDQVTFDPATGEFAVAAQPE